MKIRHYILLWLLLCIVAFFIYWPSVQAGFVSDDWHWLSLASQHTSIIPDLFSNYEGTENGGSYNPVVSFFFNINYRIFGLNALPWHIVSIIIHTLNAILVTFVFFHLQKIWHRHRKTNMFIIFTVGFLYLVWPTLTEAVSWVASIPHVLGALLFLISLAGYLQYRRKNHNAWLIVSTLAAVLAFFSKEVTISLPVILIIVEFQLQKKEGTLSIKQAAKRLYFILLGLVVFFVLRFLATGVFFGNYAVDAFQFKLFLWWHTFLTFIVELMTLGLARVWWMSVYWSYWPLLSIAIIAIIALVIRRLYIHKLQDIKIVVLLFILSLLPYIPLGFNRMSSEGERYTYVPAIFFVMMLGFVLARYASVRAMQTGMLLLIIIGALLTHYKSQNWQIAGTVAAEIVDQFPALAERYDPDSLYLVLALPDTISGAHVFRNNLQQALDLQYPDTSYTILQYPVYYQLNRSNYRSQVVETFRHKWRKLMVYRW